MLGQKIVQPSAAAEHTEGSQWPSEPYVPATSLTIRRVKSAGLRIVTEVDALWPQASLAHVNTLRRSSVNRQSYLSIKTPDTSHTFGFPNPTMPSSPKHPYSVASPPSASSSTGALHAHRYSRYSQVETALRSARASHVEARPQELQIRVLEKATAILSEQALDAQACASRLRAQLTERCSRAYPPEDLEALQREYWMEERRSAARKNQYEETRGLLTRLSTSFGPMPPSPVPASPTLTRQEANLARFLGLSPTRIDFSRNRKPSTPLTGSTHARRQTISHARPLQLRPTALDLALLSPLPSHHRRSKSFDGAHSRRNSSSTESTFVSEHSSEQSTVTLPPPPGKAASCPLVSELDGVVCIAKVASHRPREALLAEVGDVAIPGYAIDLIEDFAASPISVETLFSPVVFSRSPSTLLSPSPMSPSSQPAPQLPMLTTSEDKDNRRSLSMPDFTHYTMDDETPPQSPTIPSRAVTSSPSSPSNPLRPRSRTGNIIDRIRSPAVETPTASLPRRPATANANLRPSVTQSLNASSFKFGSVRLSSPSLMTVLESDGNVEPQRPQTSMGGYGYGTPRTGLEASENGEVKTGRGRLSFSMIRRRRFLSTPSGSDACDVPGQNVKGKEGQEGRAKSVLRELRKKLSMFVHTTD